MKQILITIALITASLYSQAQKADDMKTLVGKNTRIGAYISLENQFKDFGNAYPGIYSGARVGLIFNRFLFVGMGAYGLSNQITLRNVVEQGDIYNFYTGFGGISVEPILFPRQPIHISFPCFAGFGGASISEKGNGYGGAFDEDLYWMAQAGANIELNVTKWLRVSGGMYYAETDNFSLINTSKNLVEGVSYGMSLKIGRF